VRENRTHGSEGGDGESRSRPLSDMTSLSPMSNETRPNFWRSIIRKGADEQDGRGDSDDQVKRDENRSDPGPVPSFDGGFHLSVGNHQRSDEFDNSDDERRENRQQESGRKLFRAGEQLRDKSQRIRCGPGQKKHAREPEENKKTRKQLRHANPGIRLRHAARSSQRPSLALCRLADEKETDGPQQNGDEHQNEIPHVRLLEETSSLGLGAL